MKLQPLAEDFVWNDRIYNRITKRYLNKEHAGFISVILGINIQYIITEMKLDVDKIIGKGFCKGIDVDGDDVWLFTVKSKKSICSETSRYFRSEIRKYFGIDKSDIKDVVIQFHLLPHDYDFNELDD
jgi:hypothetical protein